MYTDRIVVVLLELASEPIGKYFQIYLRECSSDYPWYTKISPLSLNLCKSLILLYKETYSFKRWCKKLRINNHHILRKLWYLKYLLILKWSDQRLRTRACLNLDRIIATQWVRQYKDIQMWFWCRFQTRWYNVRKWNPFVGYLGLWVN